MIRAWVVTGKKRKRPRKVIGQYMLEVWTRKKDAKFDADQNGGIVRPITINFSPMRKNKPRKSKHTGSYDHESEWPWLDMPGG